MRHTSLPIAPRREPADPAGFSRPLAALGVEQRESLCRGIAFVVVLAVSCLLVVYAPLVCGDPDWAAAGVMSQHAPSAIASGDHALGRALR